MAIGRGGGTSVDEYGNVDYVELEVEINKEHEDKIPEIISKLEEFGAPVGSKMYIEGKKRAKRFGKKTGIQISINKNTVQLTIEQIAGMYRELKVIMNDREEINRIYENENEFRVYFYGDSYRDMKKEVTSYLKNKAVIKDVSVKKV